MKHLTIILTLILSFSMVNPTLAQKGTTTIKIKTSSQCGECKERIEKAFAFEKGIKKARLDVKSKILTVVYKTSKTNPDVIKKIVAKIGYDADDVLADKEAYQNLPECCKKGAGDCSEK